MIEAPTWVLGSDNREGREREKMVLCITGDSGDDQVYYEMHPIGKCPHCTYEHEIMKDEKIKVTATFYLRISGKDKHDKLEQVLDDGLSNVFHNANIEDNLYDEMYYEMDDSIDIKSKLHRLDYKKVPKTRFI
jgi:hypothetical protein